MHSRLDGARVVIAGGSGYLGLALARSLAERGAKVVMLSRTPPKAAGPWRHAAWDARTLGAWSQELDGAQAIVNLVGRTVNCIKTPDHCDEILRSRVEATLVLGEACRRVAQPPHAWVQMSTAHIYGDPPEIRCDEGSPTGFGLAPTVGRAWEEAFAKASLPTQRGVVLRTSFVIGPPHAGGAGALGTLSMLARMGMGGKVGSGRQGMSWLHIDDLCEIVVQGMLRDTMNGVYIASAPEPLEQREFMRVLRKHAGGLGALGIGLPAFSWMVRLGAPLVLKTDPELALYGRFVVPQRLLKDGFAFRYPHLDAALAHIFRG
ncbi:MAG: DUF1731 domain-containing protein [Tepidisphaera sp.]|nr:DUF1731 domain-containing protein [Tepidisphaera sp.]